MPDDQRPQHSLWPRLTRGLGPARRHLADCRQTPGDAVPSTLLLGPPAQSARCRQTQASGRPPEPLLRDAAVSQQPSLARGSDSAGWVTSDLTDPQTEPPLCAAPTWGVRVSPAPPPT